MNIDLKKISLSGLAAGIVGLLSYVAYEYENPGPLIGGVAVLWGAIEGKLHRLFGKKSSNQIDLNDQNVEVMKAKIKYLETKTQYLENKLKSSKNQ